LDELPEPQGDPIDLDELHEEQEQADAVKLAEIRAELADLSPPEGDAYSDTGESEGDNYEDETEIDAEDYEELDDYEEADDYEDEPVTEAETGEGL
jgi:hypothetical protein